MIDFLRSLTDVGFVALLVAVASGVMILLQAAISRWVWAPYVIAFVSSIVVLLVTLR